MKPPIDKNKVVVLTGAGVSAESGIPTFRDADGLWNNYSIQQVATPGAWKANPELVLDFYNERRRQIADCAPNKAHIAIAKLQEKYNTIVITQNIDDLHERAGSNQVIHVHGEITKARSESDIKDVVSIGYKDINLGDCSADGQQLRPHIVWFGETVLNYNLAREHLKTAGKVLVVGTSLSVFPVANLLKKARYGAEKIIVALDIEKRPYGYRFIRGKATEMVSYISCRWLEGMRADE
ncbi:NAD-dependent deacylase [Pleionea sp. CnH1-48]|uniref:SIR2 family NAD-dependent protein deacylase n=1 Tax=Pleionea sp. CnH1-48 TaxID=2954494 RepID=UPI002097FF2F|nr:NAD-dependent deacylase [Pleionea sp. CnH1-48]MCO7223374.1 NAD-dependent deacylase [Pleionea sp. CnH1-48]